MDNGKTQKRPDVNDWHKAGGKFSETDAVPMELPSVEEEHGATEDGAGEKPGALDDLWKTVEEWGAGWLTEKPPARRYLLHTIDDKETGEDARPMLPLGKVGMLAAAGGTGKTTALAQLAIAVATGQPWLGAFTVDEPGRVLLALGEEEADEVRRKLHDAAKGLSLEVRAEAARNIVVLPLAGRDAALTFLGDEAAELGALPRTPLAVELKARLDAAAGWKLILLDPMSRFAGPDVEKDNAAATRFIQVLETFTTVPGTPTVLFAHHTGKWSRKAEAGGAMEGDAAARGASGLTDGARWHATLDPQPAPKNAPAVPRMAIFRVVKTNYAAPASPLWLVRGEHGILRKASPEERRAYERAIKADREKQEPTESPRKSAVRGDDY